VRQRPGGETPARSPALMRQGTAFVALQSNTARQFQVGPAFVSAVGPDQVDKLSGPISLKPQAGPGWFQRGKPARQRATYRRLGGVRKLLGAYDVGADWLWGRLEDRPVTSAVVLEFLKDNRSRYPKTTTVYIVMDNLSAHWTPEIRRWAVKSNVGLIPTPTYASHLNRIECHFWAYVEFVVNGSDYADWHEFAMASHA
jgi:hypothetical protein